ncbi:MAG: amidohydrolase family protein [Chloroflexota bacterium]
MEDPDLDRAVVGEVDRSIPFVDAHHHLWELGRFRYDWLTEEVRPDGSIGPVADNSPMLGDYRMIRQDWPVDRLLKEFYGSNVIGSVHIEAAYSGPDPVQETDWLDDVADDTGFPTALVAYLDVTAPGAEATLQRHLAVSDRVRGIRPRAHPSDWAAIPAFAEAMEALARHDLSYELTVPDTILAGRDAARAFPDTRMILGHAGNPMARTRDYFARWQADLVQIAAEPNVACKVSGFGMVDHAWTIDSITPWVLACIEAFGPDRIMFGTNWPVDVVYSSYLRQVDAYRWIIARAGFSLEEQHAMLHGNAERIYALELDA